MKLNSLTVTSMSGFMLIAVLLLSSCGSQPLTSPAPAPSVETQMPSLPTAESATSSIETPEPPTSTAIPSSPSRTGFSIPLSGLNYRVQNTGDGWVEGQLDLVYENIGEEVLPPQCLIFDEERAAANGLLSYCPESPRTFISEAYIETNEGVTYPAEISPAVLRVGDLEGGSPIPVGVVFRNVRRPFASSYTLDTVTFRFAQAASPTELILVLSGEDGFQREDRIDLSNVPQALPEAQFAEERPISELLTAPIPGDNEEVETTFDGGCSYQEVSIFFKNGYVIPYTFVNQNQYEDESVILNFSYAVYYPGGMLQYSMPEIEDLSWTIGPGQSEGHRILILDEQADTNFNSMQELDDMVAASHLLVYTDQGEVDAYRLDCEIIE